MTMTSRFEVCLCFALATVQYTDAQNGVIHLILACDHAAETD